MEEFKSQVKSIIRNLNSAENAYYYCQFNGYLGKIFKASLADIIGFFFTKGGLYTIFFEAVESQDCSLTEESLLDFVFNDPRGYHGAILEKCDYSKLEMLVDSGKFYFSYSPE